MKALDPAELSSTGPTLPPPPHSLSQHTSCAISCAHLGAAQEQRGSGAQAEDLQATFSLAPRTIIASPVEAIRAGVVG